MGKCLKKGLTNLLHAVNQQTKYGECIYRLNSKSAVNVVLTVKKRKAKKKTDVFEAKMNQAMYARCC